MACNISKILDVLLKDTRIGPEVQVILDEGIVASKLLDASLLTTFGKDAEHLSTKEFTKGFTTLLQDVAGATVEKDVVFSENTIQAGITTFYGGKYTPSINTIQLSKKYTYPEVKQTLSAKFMESVSDSLKVEVAAIDTVLDEHTELVMRAIQQVSGEHVLLHELVHANAVEYMLVNPNSDVTARVELLFKEANLLADTGAIRGGYWQTDINEFMAESVSNPVLVVELMSIQPKVKLRRLGSMYDVLLNTLLSMLGRSTRDTESLFDYMLDAQLKLVSEVIVGNKAEEYQGISDTLVDTISNDAIIAANDKIKEAQKKCGK